MMRTIMLIGAGQLGSRYLQGLLRCKEDLVVTVVDPSNESLKMAEKRISDMEDRSNLTVDFKTSIGIKSGNVDLAIVATPADCRASIINELNNTLTVTYWILEKVLAQSVEQLKIIERVLSPRQYAWVNTPMRTMKWYKLIKKTMVANSEKVNKVIIEGGSWGLACNAIHYIDLVSWLSGKGIVEIDGTQLGEWKESKRPGYKEVDGTLKITLEDETFIEIMCKFDCDKPLRIGIFTSNNTWEICEGAGLAKSSDGEKVYGEIEYQSQMTGPLVDKILRTGKCGLTPLDESLNQHYHYISALSQAWSRSNIENISIVPIT